MTCSRSAELIVQYPPDAGGAVPLHAGVDLCLELLVRALRSPDVAQPGHFPCRDGVP